MQHNSTPFLHRRTGTFRSPCISLTYDPHRNAQLISRQILNDVIDVIYLTNAMDGVLFDNLKVLS